MRVYVETNFVLELVLEQKEHDACEALLQLAETSALRLILPAFCLFEADYALKGKMKDWKGPSFDRFRGLLREAGRTRGITQQADQAQQLIEQLKTALTDNVERRLRATERRLLACATLLPLNQDILSYRDELAEGFDLEAADALVLASVLRDPEFGSESAFFLNLNKKDFGDPALIEQLQTERCELRWSFAAGLHAVRAALNQTL